MLQFLKTSCACYCMGLVPPLPSLPHISHLQVKSEKESWAAPTRSDGDSGAVLLKAGTSIRAGTIFDPPRETVRSQQQACQSFDGTARSASHGSTECAPCAKYRLAQVWLPLQAAATQSHAGGALISARWSGNLRKVLPQFGLKYNLRLATSLLSESIIAPWGIEPSLLSRHCVRQIASAFACNHSHSRR